MNAFLSPVKRLFFQFLLLLSCYFISRIIFTCSNISHFEGLKLSSFFSIAFSALRFDIAAICTLNIPYVFLLFLPLKGNFILLRNKIAQFVLIFINSIALLFEISDWAYFPYNHKRATADVLNMIFRKGDFINMLPGFLQDYWYLPLSAFLLVFVFIIINKKIVAATPIVFDKKNTFLIQSLRFLIVGAAIIIGMRGGVQLVPIGIRNVVAITDSKYTAIALNTPFSIIATFQNNRLKEEHYFDEITLKQYLNTTKKYASRPFIKRNVVVLVLESFSKEFTGIGGAKSYTPFLDSLMEKSFVCTNAFANVNRSADAIPAILAGIPTLQEEPFTTSPYGANKITSIANLLATKGYSSAFYHGGTNGTMAFDLFAANAGFQNYKGRKEYADDKDFDGRWGIWDEAFLQYAVNDFKNLPQPFCASVFTLSSHQPFSIPEVYKNKFPKGTLPVHETIGYTDNALRLFFKNAATQSWFQNTLFVLVADHCFPLSDDEYYHYQQGRFAIPIIYYVPGDSILIGKNSFLTQQIDILPSVMDYLGYPDSFFAFGNSVFSETPYRYTIQHWSGENLWTKDNYFLKVINGKPTSFYDAVNDKLCKDNLLHKNDSLAQNAFLYLKAFRQSYTDVMLYNGLWLK